VETIGTEAQYITKALLDEGQEIDVPVLNDSYECDSSMDTSKNVNNGDNEHGAELYSIS
jgi:hypothetical protein